MNEHSLPYIRNIINMVRRVIEKTQCIGKRTNLCTHRHPNNNSQKFQNSNPEIKWINGELNNKLFYKIFLIILKWFYTSTLHYDYIMCVTWCVHIYVYKYTYKSREEESKGPPISIRTYRKRWCIQHTFIWYISHV